VSTPDAPQPAPETLLARLKRISRYWETLEAVDDPQEQTVMDALPVLFRVVEAAETVDANFWGRLRDALTAFR